MTPSEPEQQNHICRVFLTFMVFCVYFRHYSHIRTMFLSLTGYTFLIIKKNWFLAFPNKGVKHYGSKAHGRNGPRALGPSCSMKNSILLSTGCQLSQVVTLSLTSSPGVYSPPEKRQIKFSSVQFSRSVVSDSLQPHGPQHARLPCLSPTPGVYPNSCPSSW